MAEGSHRIVSSSCVVHVSEVKWKWSVLCRSLFRLERIHAGVRAAEEGCARPQFRSGGSCFRTCIYRKIRAVHVRFQLFFTQNDVKQPVKTTCRWRELERKQRLHIFSLWLLPAVEQAPAFWVCTGLQLLPPTGRPPPLVSGAELRRG